MEKLSSEDFCKAIKSLGNENVNPELTYYDPAWEFCNLFTNLENNKSINSFFNRIGNDIYIGFILKCDHLLVALHTERKDYYYFGWLRGNGISVAITELARKLTELRRFEFKCDSKITDGKIECKDTDMDRISSLTLFYKESQKVFYEELEKYESCKEDEYRKAREEYNTGNINYLKNTLDWMVINKQNMSRFIHRLLCITDGNSEGDCGFFLNGTTFIACEVMTVMEDMDDDDIKLINELKKRSFMKVAWVQMAQGNNFKSGEATFDVDYWVDAKQVFIDAKDKCTDYVFDDNSPLANVFVQNHALFGEFYKLDINEMRMINESIGILEHTRAELIKSIKEEMSNVGDKTGDE